MNIGLRKRIHINSAWVIIDNVRKYPTCIDNVKFVSFINNCMFLTNFIFFCQKFIIVSEFFFRCFYPLGIMQPFLFRHDDLSFASLSAVPHVSSIFFKSPSNIFLRVILASPVSFCLEDSILSPSWESFSVSF